MNIAVWIPVLVLTALSAANSKPAIDPVLDGYLAPQDLIEVAPGRRLNLFCVGEGAPTVVLESGMGEPTGTWARVQPLLGRELRTCSYDREGVGFSDDGTGDGSALSAVQDLERLLAAAKIEPPYILVAQSYGALIARLYYYQHPQNLQGMVLIDPSLEEQGEGMRMVSPREFDRAGWGALADEADRTRQRCMDAARTRIEEGHPDEASCVVPPPPGTPSVLVPGYLEMQRHARFQRAQQDEELAFRGRSIEQLRAARRSFGSLPLIVLTRSRDISPLRDWETARLRAARENVWFGLHRWLSDASGEGEHRVVADSSHAMHLSNPDAVLAAIRDVVRRSSELAAGRGEPE